MMRNELNQIETVELYLSGELNIAEQTAFETQMATDAKLTELVAAQQLVQQAALRKAIRADVLKYGAGGGFFAKWWIAIAGVGIIALCLGGIYLYNSIDDYSQNQTNYKIEKQVEVNSENESSIQTKSIEKTELIEEVSLKIDELDTVPGQDSMEVSEVEVISKNGISKEYSYEEDTHCDGLKTWATPKQQIFEVIAEKGATLEGDDGTLIIVPKNAFEDNNGKVIKGKVQVELVEALRMSEMVAYNLTTMNGDKALQSGGMIYVQPRVDGKEVKISQTNPLYIEIPIDDYNSAMMAWEGEVDANGDINWTNPQPLKKFLTKVDFKNLDFLPDGFESAVSAGMPFKSYKKATDELVDSLYYSLGIENLIGNETSLIVIDTAAPNQFTKNIDGIGIGGVDSKYSMEYLIQDVKWLFSRKSIHGKGVLSGYVTDEDGKRAGYAQLTILQNGRTNKKMITANKHGKFYIDKLEEGAFILSGKSNTKTLTGSGLLSDSIGILNKGDTIKLKQSLVLTNTVRNFNGKMGNGEIPLTIGGYRNYEPKKSVEKVCFINPLSVKTIKTDDFANTFLATKEFQERIKLLHGLENSQGLFDLYLNNLSKDLWQVDQMVANKLQGDEKVIFQKLADQQLTNVESDGIYQKQLSAYYNSKLKTFKKELKAQKKEYAKSSTEQLRKEQAKLNDLISNYNDIAFKIDGKNQSRNSENLSTFENIVQKPSARSASLSPSKISRNVISSRNSYATPWFEPGWMNIDAYLHELSKGSQEVEIKDENSKGQKGRTKVYQCLNALKTVVPLTISGWVAKAKFPKSNSAMGAKMRSTYCIGIKKDMDKTYLAHQKFNPYKTSEVELEWSEVESKNLIDRLIELPGFNTYLINNLKNEEKRIQEELKELARREELKEKQNGILKNISEQEEIVSAEQAKLYAENCFIETLREVVDKCGTRKYSISVNGVYSFVEVMPEFSGGSETLYQYLSDSIVYPKEAMDEGAQGKVYVQFIVTELGKITDVEVMKGAHPLLDEEALRVVKGMPDWKAGKNQGNEVPVRFTLPISFRID